MSREVSYVIQYQQLQHESWYDLPDGYYGNREKEEAERRVRALNSEEEKSGSMPIRARLVERSRIDRVLGEESREIDPNLWMAVEFGFKASEKGWNLEQTRIEFEKLM